MTIQHTSSHEQGQIYIGGVNWALMVGVVLLVLGFESSASLAAAYGVAVTGTMLITTLLMGVVIWRLWKWPLWLGVPFFCVMLAVDSLFFAANLPKVIQGGAFPVIAGIVIFILMSTWKRGRQLLVERLDEGSLPLSVFISSMRVQPPHRVRGPRCSRAYRRGASRAAAGSSWEPRSRFDPLRAPDWARFCAFLSAVAAASVPGCCRG